jgi:hypothetical protein
LLKNETEVYEHSFLISSSLKNETTYEDSFFVSMETSIKNEIEVMSIVLVSMSSLLKNEIVFPPLCLSQVLSLVFEDSFPPPLSLDETKLGGQYSQPLDFMLKLEPLTS